MMDQNNTPEIDHTLLSAEAVRNRFGGISKMTLWRWLQDPELDFPKPFFVSRAVRFFVKAEIDEFILRRLETR